MVCLWTDIDIIYAVSEWSFHYGINGRELFMFSRLKVIRFVSTVSTSIGRRMFEPDQISK